MHIMHMAHIKNFYGAAIKVHNKTNKGHELPICLPYCMSSMKSVTSCQSVYPIAWAVWEVRTQQSTQCQVHHSGQLRTQTILWQSAVLPQKNIEFQLTQAQWTPQWDAKASRQKPRPARMKVLLPIYSELQSLESHPPTEDVAPWRLASWSEV